MRLSERIANGESAVDLLKDLKRLEDAAEDILYFIEENEDAIMFVKEANLREGLGLPLLPRQMDAFARLREHIKQS